MYVHATSSKTLMMLPRTEFQLVDLNTLIFEYGIAPMAGEIFAGGVEGTGNNMTSFALVKKGSFYSFDSLLKGYGEQKQKLDLTQQQFDSILSFAPTNGLFSEIRAHIVNILRHQQMGYQFEISDDTIEQTVSAFKNYRIKMEKLFSALFAVAKFLHYDDMCEISRFNIVHDFFDNLWTQMPPGYLNMSCDEQSTFLSSLNIPNEIKVTERKTNSELNHNADHIGFALNLALQHHNRGSEFMVAVWGISQPELNFERIQNWMEECLNRYDQNCQLFIRILRGEHQVLSLANQPSNLSLFPVFFILEDDNCVKQFGYEYRSTRNLKISDDIRTIAVPPEHIQETSDFFAQHNITISVISLDVLASSWNTGALPAMTTETSSLSPLPQYTLHRSSAAQILGDNPEQIQDLLQSLAVRQGSEAKANSRQ